MFNKKNSKNIEKIKNLREENRILRNEIKDLKNELKNKDEQLKGKMEIVENTRLEYIQMIEDTRKCKDRYTKLIEQMKKFQKEMKTKMKEV